MKQRGPKRGPKKKERMERKKKIKQLATNSLQEREGYIMSEEVGKRMQICKEKQEKGKGKLGTTLVKEKRNKKRTTYEMKGERLNAGTEKKKKSVGCIKRNRTL